MTIMIIVMMIMIMIVMIILRSIHMMIRTTNHKLLIMKNLQTRMQLLMIIRVIVQPLMKKNKPHQQLQAKMIQAMFHLAKVNQFQTLPNSI
jgi:hypothetical protein